MLLLQENKRNGGEDLEYVAEEKTNAACTGGNFVLYRSKITKQTLNNGQSERTMRLGIKAQAEESKERNKLQEVVGKTDKNRYTAL